jgi:hypothetical protein
MAKAITQSWTKLTVWPGDGATPEVFTNKSCGFVSKGFNLAATASETTVPDCDNPDLPAWTERVVRSSSGGFSGSGAMAEQTYAFWRTWFLSGVYKNVRIVVDGTAIGYYAGKFILTRLETTGNQGDAKIQVNVTLDSDGEITWVAGAP